MKHKTSKRRFTTKQRVAIVDPTPEEFVQAVQTAEKRVIATMEERGILPVGEALVFLAICTKAALIGSTRFQMSENEIQETVFHILDDPHYLPGPDFPYTKRQMSEVAR